LSSLNGHKSWATLSPEIATDLRGIGRNRPHVAIMAPTGGGKTVLALEGILPHFPNALILDTTGDPNPPMSNYGEPLKKRGPIEGHRRLTVSSLTNESKAKIHKAMEKAFAQGDIAIYCDEVRQLADKRYFGMQPNLEYLWLFGRKRGVSVIGATQAPRFVPSALYDQSRMHFIFRIRDKRAQKRLSEISGDVDTLDAITPNLEQYEFAYVNPLGDVVRSMFQK
jgi:hypothetical protein